MITLRSQEVTVERLNLIKVLRTNRAKHQEDYQKALLDWKIALTSELKALSDKAHRGDFTDIKIESVEPSHSLSQYNDVIEMLEMSVEENIKLDKESFRAFVKDEWFWKGNFERLINANASVTSKYSGF